MKIERGNFGSKVGIVLATAGSAVGLGNVWRFPYMAGENGGAAFILIYIACIFILGIPGMLSEFIVGRHGQANAARSYDKLSGGKPWKFIGYLGILTSTIILGFYAVVAGWCLQYLFASIVGQLSGDVQYVKAYFQDFSCHPVYPVLWGVYFILVTQWVVMRGVRSGIERASKFLMPILLILLLVLVVASCMLPGAVDGIRFLLKPDFSKLSGGVMLEALGQAFFSLSLGTACLCTYASYFTKYTNLLNSAGQIALLDTIIAVLAGLMIFPAAASVGVSPDSGPSLIFITLPNVFQQAFSAAPFVGYIVSLMFFVLLSLAALTSLMSLHEVATAFFEEEFHTTRKHAAIVVTTTTIVIGAFCSLSLGATDTLTFFGRSLFSWFDFITGQIFLPIVGFLTCIFIGWYVDHQIVRDEFTNWGELRGRFFHLYIFLVKYVCPLAILLIFLHQLGALN